MAFDRRTFLATCIAACVGPPALAQTSFNFGAAAAYSAERRGVSLLVMQGGRVVFEDYPNGGGADRGWELASGTKSFTGVMAAAAVQDRLLDWDEFAADALREWRGDERRAITIRHLLSLTSGIEGGPIARPPSYADAIAQRAMAPPGERFAYGPTPFQIFGEIMRRKTNGDPLDYLHRRVLDPMGINPTHWRRGSDGMPHLPSGAGLTARDWARFGEFLRNKGAVNGAQLVPSAWIEFMTTANPRNPGYGAQTWLNRAQPGEDERPFPGAPRSAFSMNGHLGQFVLVVPDRELTIVRLGKTLDGEHRPVRTAMGRIAALYSAREGK
ncbi:MAG: serine hydrolase domain-containing protein [Alphaproteobacteria bacterium]